jgi:hypothetical protein
MLPKKQTYLSSPVFPSIQTKPQKKHSSIDPLNEQPRKPDWLVLLMSALFLITLLIAWLVNIPAILH